MWLLSTDHLELRCFNSPEEVAQACPSNSDQCKPGYAILSHVWDDVEQSFVDIRQLQIDGVTSYAHPKVFKKVRECVNVARAQGYAWVWDDTCCIDQRSSAELEEAINSMFLWYTEAAVCFAYLKDVPDDCLPGEKGAISEPFRNSIWFKRGWTLQELLAPRYLVFLSKEWRYLGTKDMLADVLQKITGIGADVLTFRRPLQHVPVAVRMSWAAGRQTKKIEDQAYSLLGLFGVSMSTIYGEGSHAFQRLQAKIMKRHADHTLFAWGRTWTADIGEMQPMRRSASDPGHQETHAGSSRPDFEMPNSALDSPPPAQDRYPSFTPPSFEQSRSMFASCPSDFHFGVSANLVPVSFEEASLAVQKFVDVQSDLKKSAVLYEQAVTSAGVRCNFIVISGTPFSLALLLCKDSAGRCLALPLWPYQDSRSPVYSSRPFRAGISFLGSSESYRLFALSHKTFIALRKRGWMSLAVGSARSDVSTQDLDRLTVPLPSTTAPLSTRVIGTIETIYIANTSHSTLSHHLRELRQEPTTVFIPTWIPDYIARYNLKLESSSAQQVGKITEVPFTLCIFHKDRPTHAEFKIQFNRCGGILFARVEFTAGPPPPDTALRWRQVETPSNICKGSGAEPHAHINVWKNGSYVFSESGKVVQLTATPWPITSAYCFDIRLGGAYAGTARKPEDKVARPHLGLLAPPGTSATSSIQNLARMWCDIHTGSEPEPLLQLAALRIRFSPLSFPMPMPRLFSSLRLYDSAESEHVAQQPGPEIHDRRISPTRSLPVARLPPAGIHDRRMNTSMPWVLRSPFAPGQEHEVGASKMPVSLALESCGGFWGGEELDGQDAILDEDGINPGRSLTMVQKTFRRNLPKKEWIKRRPNAPFAPAHKHEMSTTSGMSSLLEARGRFLRAELGAQNVSGVLGEDSDIPGVPDVA